MPTVNGPNGSYEVGDLVAESSRYRLYLCTQSATGRACLFKIAKSAEHNAALEREAYFLRLMREKADALETTYAPHRKYEGERLNYHLHFAEVLESFLFTAQGNRRVTVLAFAFVNNLSHLKSLDHVLTKGRKRADQRSSVWVMGKLLKLLTFAHSINLSIELLGPKRLFIEPDQHYAIVSDLTEAVMHPDGLTIEESRAEIVKLATSVIALIGGDFQHRSFPADPGGDERYVRRLLELASGSESRAKEAHQKFYELADEIWPRGVFYPFTTFDL